MADVLWVRSTTGLWHEMAAEGTDGWVTTKCRLMVKPTWRSVERVDKQGHKSGKRCSGRGR